MKKLASLLTINGLVPTYALLKVNHERSKQRDINLPKIGPLLTKRFYCLILQSEPKITHHICIIVRYFNYCANVIPKCFQYDDQFRPSCKITINALS